MAQPGSSNADLGEIENDSVMIPDCFRTGLPYEQQLSPYMDEETYLQLKEHFNKKVVDREAQDKVKNLHFWEGDWEVVGKNKGNDPIVEGVKFWSRAHEVLRLIGPYIDALVLELQESDLKEVKNAFRITKLDFLMSLPTMLPNLRALKLTGEGVGGASEADRALYSEKAKSLKLGLTTLVVDEGFEYGFMGSLLRSLIISGASTLRHLELPVNIVPLPEEDDNDTAVFTHVSSVVLSKFGCWISQDESFREGMRHMFPNIQTMEIRRIRSGSGLHLNKLVDTLVEHCSLQELILDPLVSRHLAETAPKIKRIHKLILDVGRVPSFSLAIMEHIAKVDIVVVRGSDKSGLSTETIEADIRDACVNVGAVEFLEG